MPRSRSRSDSDATAPVTERKWVRERLARRSLRASSSETASGPPANGPEAAGPLTTSRQRRSTASSTDSDREQPLTVTGLLEEYGAALSFRERVGT
jgi:hypothetical protein